MFGIVANVIESKTFRNGAKVLVIGCNGDAERPIVEGLCKNGHKVQGYTAYKKLANFRAKSVTDVQAGYVWPEWRFDTREDAEKVAARLNATPDSAH